MKVFSRVVHRLAILATSVVLTAIERAAMAEAKKKLARVMAAQNPLLN
jgi:hypothetical protein